MFNLTSIRIVLLLACCKLSGNLACTAEAPRPLLEPDVPYNPEVLQAKVNDRLNEDKFSFAVFGDSRGGTNFKAVLEQAEKLKPDFVLTTGDMVSRGSKSKADWEALEQVAGPFMRRVPTWPAMGNHEIMGGQEGLGLATFLAFYGLKRSYYSFQVRHARFIALSWPLPRKQELDFLKAELAAGRAARQHLFVFLHMPFFTVGEKPETEVPNRPTEITNLFSEHKVAAVFSGHDHIYYRTVRKSVPYIISAGAGAEIYQLKRTNEAQDGDSFYGLDPTAKKYHLQLPSADRPAVKVFDKEQHYFLFVAVTGPRVTLKAVSHTGECWEEAALQDAATAKKKLEPAGVEK